MSSNRSRLAIAAAIVAVAMMATGCQPGRDSGSPRETPTPGPTATPTPPPTPPASVPPASPPDLPVFGELGPGTYEIGEPFPLKISFTIGEGWEMWTSGTAPDVVAISHESPDPPDGRGIVFGIVTNVYADPCDPAGGELVPPLGPGVDELASALAGQPNTQVWRERDVSLAGHSGQYLEYLMNGEDPACPTLARWPSSQGDREAVFNQYDQVWILDVDGVRLVVDAFSFDGATAADRAQMRDIVESIQIAP